MSAGRTLPQGIAVMVFALTVIGCMPPPPPPGPQFSVGSRVMIVSQANVILRRECGQLMSAVVGLAENGDEVLIRDRRYCASEWWYLIEVPALHDHPAMDDTGWVQESTLKNR